MGQEGTKPHFPSTLLNGSVVREIYASTPKWWTRWTWPLLAGITIWSAVGAETAFYHWTRRRGEDPPVPTENDGPESTAVDSTNSETPEWELRPLYQRALMSGSILAFGTGIGILFLSTRSRIVRRLFAVSGPVPFRQNFTPLQSTVDGAAGRPEDFRFVLVETIANSSGKGKVFSKEECELAPGRDDSEMVLKVPGTRYFWLDLKGAMVERSFVPQGIVRQRLLELWEGHKAGSGRWVRGPIVR